VKRGGRPLRFLGTTLAGWTGVRLMLLWPGAAIVASAPIGVTPHIEQATAQAPTETTMPETVGCCRDRPMPRIAAARGRYWSAGPVIGTPVPHRYSREVMALALAGLTDFGEARATGPRQSVLVAPPLAAPPLLQRARTASRWSASAWLIVRDGHAAGPAFGGDQLGGSQAGARLAYMLDRTHRIAVVARVATPLSDKGREAAIGVEWQPASRIPVRIVAEERLSLGGGKNGPALGVIAGINPAPVALGFRLEAYGQAGVIDRGSTQGFADGAARIARPVVTIGPIKFDVGGGAWGGAQQGAARLDVGPSLGAVVPIGPVPVRINLDWRQRVAGHARPGSGLALSLGTDF
jgi:hypothetical protein